VLRIDEANAQLDAGCACAFTASAGGQAPQPSEHRLGLRVRREAGSSNAFIAT
jgi:hypothetical protein